MADAAQRTIQLAIVWFLKKRRAKRARMIEEKRSSFLYIYIYNRQRKYYFGQLLLACINQLDSCEILQLSKDNCMFSSDHRSIKADVASTDQVFPRFFPDTEASDLSDDAILFVEEHVRMCD